MQLVMWRRRRTDVGIQCQNVFNWSEANFFNMFNSQFFGRLFLSGGRHHRRREDGRRHHWGREGGAPDGQMWGIHCQMCSLDRKPISSMFSTLSRGGDRGRHHRRREDGGGWCGEGEGQVLGIQCWNAFNWTSVFSSLSWLHGNGLFQQTKDEKPKGEKEPMSSDSSDSSASSDSCPFSESESPEAASMLLTLSDMKELRRTHCVECDSWPLVSLIPAGLCWRCNDADRSKTNAKDRHWLDAQGWFDCQGRFSIQHLHHVMFFTTEWQHLLSIQHSQNLWSPGESSATLKYSHIIISPGGDTSQHDIIDSEVVETFLESNKSPSLFTSQLPLQALPEAVKLITSIQYQNKPDKRYGKRYGKGSYEPYTDKPNLGLFLN